MSPAHTLRVADLLFFAVFTAAGGTGAPATQTDSPSVAVVGPRVRQGDPWPDEPDPSAMERRDQKHNQQHTPPSSSTTQSRSPPKPHHTSHASHPTTNPTQVLDHPQSKLRAGGQAPAQPSQHSGGWPKTQCQSQNTSQGPGPRWSHTRRSLRHEHDSHATPQSHDRNRLTPGRLRSRPLSPLVGMALLTATPDLYSFVCGLTFQLGRGISVFLSGAYGEPFSAGPCGLTGLGRDRSSWL